jgi:hypothetical protein
MLQDSEQATDNVLSCSEGYPNLAIQGGIEQFSEYIEYPEWAVSSNMRGELVYRLSIAQDGEVTDYVQESRMDRSGIPQAFEQAIEEQLRFEPTGEESVIRCNYSFRYEAR